MALIPTPSLGSHPDFVFARRHSLCLWLNKHTPAGTLPLRTIPCFKGPRRSPLLSMASSRAASLRSNWISCTGEPASTRPQIGVRSHVGNACLFTPCPTFGSINSWPKYPLQIILSHLNSDENVASQPMSTIKGEHLEKVDNGAPRLTYGHWITTLAQAWTIISCKQRSSI